ncbi:equilibrative nucleobase transporter 1 isoform X2 [Hyperolius riggenbachi]|uniref:equilibrative nucleobase transporter 1 isoform X2 n=1 Tax=Hyperolius riggenbachi TaxID=752182 RepID=UPI0035A3916F
MRCKQILTLLTGLVECLCFAGVTFGWASLVFVLKKEKYFQDFCPDAGNHTINSTDSCLPQDEQFSLIFTVAAFMNNIMTFPCGFMFDHFGTAVTRLFGILFYTAATLLIAFSSADSGFLLFPALSLLATGGIILILTNMQVGNLFGSQRSLVITLYNGAFDSSAVMFLIVKVLYQNGISLRALFLCISSCSVFHILRTIILMPKKHIPFPLPEGYVYGVSCGKAIPDSITPSTPSTDGEVCRDVKALAADPTLNSNMECDKQVEASCWNCAISSLFGWHLVWLSFMQLRHYLFIGTLNTTITRLSGGDLHTATKKIDDLHSSVLSLFVTTILSILFSLSASVSLLPMLYPTFIFQVLNRSFLYGGNAAFLSIAFPSKHFGKLYGLMMSVAAVISLLQYPAFYIIRFHLHGDPLYVNIFLIFLMLVTFAHPLNVFRIYKNARKTATEP